MKEVGINPDDVIYVSDDPKLKTPTKWDKYCEVCKATKELSPKITP